MKLKAANRDGIDRADHLLRCVAAYTQNSRAIPSHILTELCALQSCWQNRDDVPAVVVDACGRRGRLEKVKP